MKLFFFEVKSLFIGVVSIKKYSNLCVGCSYI